MDIQLAIGLILSGIISLIVYKFIGADLKKLIKIIYCIFVPVGSLIWIHEIFMCNNISSNQFGAIYLLFCVISTLVARIGNIIDRHINISSAIDREISLLYATIFALTLFTYMYILE